jgi:hypothetical protein
VYDGSPKPSNVADSFHFDGLGGPSYSSKLTKRRFWDELCFSYATGRRPPVGAAFSTTKETEDEQPE